MDILLQFLQKSQDEKNKLQAENSQIFCCLQNLLTNASLVSFSFFTLLYLH